MVAAVAVCVKFGLVTVSEGRRRRLTRRGGGRDKCRVCVWLRRRAGDRASRLSYIAAAAVKAGRLWTAHASLPNTASSVVCRLGWCSSLLLAPLTSPLPTSPHLTSPYIGLFSLPPSDQPQSQLSQCGTTHIVDVPHTHSTLRLSALSVSELVSALLTHHRAAVSRHTRLLVLSHIAAPPPPPRWLPHFLPLYSQCFLLRPLLLNLTPH